MQYTVIYRAPSGEQLVEIVEAKSREQLFVLLNKRGINVIRVTEGICKTRKNVPIKSSQISSGRKKYKLAFVIILPFIALLFMLLLKPWSEGNKIKMRLLRSESHESEALTTNSVLKNKIVGDRINGRNQVTNLMQCITEERTSAIPKNQKKGFRIVSLNENKKRLFHTVADAYISRLVNSTPGSAIIGSMNYDRFKDQFLKALQQPIIIDETDSEDEVAKKQAVIETRKELQRMLDEGEDIAQVMKDAEAEMRSLWQYRRSLHLELAKTIKGSILNPDEMQDYVDAANKILLSNGMKPLKYPQFWIRRLQNERRNANR